LGVLLSALSVDAIPANLPPKRDVDLRFPYTGPAVPIADVCVEILSFSIGIDS